MNMRRQQLTEDQYHPQRCDSEIVLPKYIPIAIDQGANIRYSKSNMVENQDGTDEMPTKVWLGRVERKMKRKHRVELSLKMENLERTQTVYVPKPGDSRIYVQHPTCLRLQALVKATVTRAENSRDDRTWDVQKLELLECPPDPLAIKAVLQVPELWKTLQPYDIECDKVLLQEDYGAVNHAMVRRIVMRLQRREPEQPRLRPPHVNFKVLKELEVLEQQVDLVDLRVSNADDLSKSAVEEAKGVASVVGWNLPATGDDRVLLSARHKLTRQEYLESKKFPQVAWFLQRLRSFPGQPVRHVLDVGGGRGDLAIALALGLGPDTRVTVVDMNEASLEAGRLFAEQCGVADRMDWICDNFVKFASTDNVSGENHCVDMVVALHACGNLSDLALDYAVNQNAGFLVCPCCYSKMKHQDVASRLAEISDRPDLSRRGMHIVNSKRYWDLTARDSYQVLLEEYSRKWSSRNMVLAGWPRQQ